MNVEPNYKILPPNWEKAFDPQSNKYFYVDHNLKQTTWLHPLEMHHKPKHPSSCQGDELPCGWERIDDPTIGTYYVDHIQRKNQWTNPVSDWRRRESILNQHYYSNSHDITSHLEQNNGVSQYANNVMSNTSQSKPELTMTSSSAHETSSNSFEILGNMANLSLSDSRNNRNNCANSHKNDYNLGSSETNSESMLKMNTNVSRSSKQFDASLLDIMDHRFGKNSNDSIEV